MKWLLSAAIVLSMAAPTLAYSAEQGAPDGAMRLSIADTKKRIADYSPELRARAAERLLAEVQLRRSRYDRLKVASGANAGHGIAGYGLGATADSAKSPGSTFSDGFAAQLYADVRLPLYAGGALTGAIDAASARVEAAGADASLSVEELKRSALVAYAACLAAERNLEVSRTARERAMALVNLAETRNRTGVGSLADVARTRLTALSRDEELAAREGDVAVAYATFRALLVLDENAPVALTDSLDALADYGTQAKSAYPEMRAANARVNAADRDADVARAGYIPNVELFAAGAYGTGAFTGTAGGTGLAPSAGPVSDRFGPFHGEVAAGAVVTWRGFDMFIVRDKIAAADRASDVARANRDETQRAVTGRRAESRAREERAKHRVDVLRTGDSTAKQAVDLARVRYETGNTILTEVLDAELERISVQARIVDAAYDLSVAHIERLRAEGLSL